MDRHLELRPSIASGVTPRRLFATCLALLLLLGIVRPAAAQSLSRSVFDVLDTNPEDGVFEAELTVDELDVLMNGVMVHAMVYKDVNQPGIYSGTPDGLPIPQIVVDVGDEVIVELHNDLSPCNTCDTSIHWHGIELDNDSDGTGVTQNHVAPGESYTYYFRPPRPGIFWFHPHMKPGPQTFAGVYGVFIVRDPDAEQSLLEQGVIPTEANTHTIVLSDIEFDEEGDVGYLRGNDAEPWEELKEACQAGDMDACKAVADADVVLVNGQSVDITAMTPRITAASGTGVRLRLLNLSTNRYFRLSMSGNDDNTIYRIGGEGGFLEFVRVEGGVLDAWDTKFDPGELLIPASSRADAVIVPTGNTGDLILIEGLRYERGGPSDLSAAGELLWIEIDNNLPGDPFSIDEGDELLGADGIDDLKAVATLDAFLDPVPVIPGNPGSGSGTANPEIGLEGIEAGKLAINDTIGEFEDSGDDFTQVPFQDETRYALTGDTLEMLISNGTGQHHPFHHHGFSFQPVRVLDDNGIVLFAWDYEEFVDVIDVFSRQTVVIRMRLDDRCRITDDRQEAAAPEPGLFFASGGAAGRWVFHCHLFLHAAIGMISELVVLDTDRDGDGFDTSEDCDDFDPTVNPDADEHCGDGIDNDCDGMIDECGITCFGVSELEVKAAKLVLEAALAVGPEFDPVGQDFTFQFEDGADGDLFEFFVPAGSFVPDDPDEYEFKSPKLRAEFDLDDCEMSFEAKAVVGLGEAMDGPTVTVRVLGSLGVFAEETVLMDVKVGKLTYEADPPPDCCPEQALASSDLALDIDPEVVWSGQAADIEVRGGAAGEHVSVFLVSLDGMPVNVPLASATFGETGRAHLVPRMPLYVSLVTHDMALRAISVDPNTGLTRLSDVEMLTVKGGLTLQ